MRLCLQLCQLTWHLSMTDLQFWTLVFHLMTCIYFLITTDVFQYHLPKRIIYLLNVVALLLLPVFLYPFTWSISAFLHISKIISIYRLISLPVQTQSSSLSICRVLLLLFVCLKITNDCNIHCFDLCYWIHFIISHRFDLIGKFFPQRAVAFASFSRQHYYR